MCAWHKGCVLDLSYFLVVWKMDDYTMYCTLMSFRNWNKEIALRKLNKNVINIAFWWMEEHWTVLWNTWRRCWCWVLCLEVAQIARWCCCWFDSNYTIYNLPLVKLFQEITDEGIIMTKSSQKIRLGFVVTLEHLKNVARTANTWCVQLDEKERVRAEPTRTALWSREHHTTTMASYQRLHTHTHTPSTEEQSR